MTSTTNINIDKIIIQHNQEKVKEGEQANFKKLINSEMKKSDPKNKIY